MAADILFQQPDWKFSYRVGALIYHNDKLLVQRSAGDAGYALPGGYVSFGEFTAETLARELRDKTGIALKVGRLCFVVELFYQGDKPCQQINLFYLADLKNTDDLPQGTFHPYDESGRERAELEYSWIDVEKLEKTKLYPACIRPYLKKLPPHTVHLCQKDL
ncbi:MAG: NUDIX domain-containing protein [Clostridia bacterium]|nr:NUDIX domain-containing protein [Clostridia bacterium]